MSVNNFLRILVRALEARDHEDPTSRQSVYDMSRRTLERFFEQTPSIDADGRHHQRGQLEAAIAEIEHQFTSAAPPGATGGAGTPPSPRAAPEPLAALPPDEPVAPPPARRSEPASSVAAPPPGAAPSPPPPEPATAEPPEPREPAAEPLDARLEDRGEEDRDELEAGRAEARHLPPADDLFATSEEAEEEEDRVSEEDDQAFEDDGERRRRNRRGTLILGVTVLALVLAYETGVGTVLYRLATSGSLPKAVVVVDKPSPDDLSADGRWADLVARRLAPLAEANATSAHLRVEDAKGDDKKEYSGRITWVGAGTGADAAWRGHLVAPEAPFGLDLALESNTDPISGFDRMAIVALDRSSDPLLETPMFKRVDPASGRRREVDGVAVRVGLDRILYGFKPEPGDHDGTFDTRPLYEFAFGFESGRRGNLLIRLPGAK